MRVVAIVQARMGSTRLPGKVMRKIGDMPMIGVLLSRLARSKKITKIVIATSVDSENNQLIDYVGSLGYECYSGKENDVLNRYYNAAKFFNAEVVIRITADCPLIDPQLVDEMIIEYKRQNLDYLSNTIRPTYPDGLDVEIFTFQALSLASELATSEYDREHVTPFIKREDRFRRGEYISDEDYSSLRWTVDEKSDLLVVNEIFKHFYPDIHFNWRNVLKLNQSTPELFSLNQSLIRNEGGEMGTGQKLWRRAKEVIPGGNMLLSKRPEMFLPDKWPAYFSRAHGCSVWDLDGNEFVDMSIMGIGTNTLGYGNLEVDQAVRGVIDMGNMSTLNCPEEVFLAEKLVELHPWADMVRLARSGGEANAIAVRIARAASGKDNVAICGYHGWHDWYLSANLGDEENLVGHLLPGLEPNGVPKCLSGTVFPFSYNNYEELERIVNTKEIGVIKMEVMRNSEPTNNFLHKVRELASKNGIVLIFDECTSGFRETEGGLHKKYGVNPDIAMFGKALGNGYAITAIIGRREVMEAAQTTFISSTFWTERIGPVAALKTLEVMRATKSWEQITKIGNEIKKGWHKLAESNGINITHWGMPALAGFTVGDKNSLVYKTYITQEMLAKGYLAGNCVYACTEHTDSVLVRYFENLAPIFEVISDCESGRRSIDSLLKGPISHAGFKRLN
jgi:glutamate-1-semialdehyde 2,1-aminomutase